MQAAVNKRTELTALHTPQIHAGRVVELDPAIDTSRIVAKMNQGVLTLSLPKSEEVKPRRIAVND